MTAILHDERDVDGQRFQVCLPSVFGSSLPGSRFYRTGCRTRFQTVILGKLLRYKVTDSVAAGSGPSLFIGFPKKSEVLLDRIEQHNLLSSLLGP